MIAISQVAPAVRRHHWFKMVQTRTRDHGVAEKGLRKGPKKDLTNKTTTKSNGGQVAPKRSHTDEESAADGSSTHEHDDIGVPPTKKTKHEDPGSGEEAKEHKNEREEKPADIAKVHDILSKYGALPLSDIGLKQASEATPETILAFIFHAMLTSARISHELAYKSVKCLIEAGYHDVYTLKNSSWQKRTEVLTEGGYTRYREKTATALGELADFVLEQYGTSSLPFFH